MKSRKRIVLGAVVASVGLALLAQSAFAFALRPVDGPKGYARDWSQVWMISDTAFDHLQFLMVSPGDAFATPDGIDGFTVVDWVQTFNDGELMLADGPATNTLYFTTHFTGASADPLMFHLQWWSGTNMVGESTATWDWDPVDARWEWKVTGGSPWANVRVDAAYAPHEADLTLVPDPGDPSCYHVGDLITVNVDMSNATQLIVGGQFFLGFDTYKLDFVSADPGDAPFTREIFEDVHEAAGTIDYVVGVPDGNPGTSADTTMAVLTFLATHEICDASNLINFRQHCPPSRLTISGGGAVYATMWELPAITIDSTPPVFDNCPGTVLPGDPILEVWVECDELEDTYPVYDEFSQLIVTATDGCDSDPLVEFDEVRTNGPCDDIYTLERTWTATDFCGNERVCKLIIHVEDTTTPSMSGCPQTFITVECDAVPDPADVTAEDNCDPDPVVDFFQTRIDGPCEDTYTLLRTWMATDRCGNWTTCAQQITVEDTTDPVIDPATCPEDITVECDAVPTAVDPVATDNCDTDLDLEYTEVQTDHACEDSYTLTRTWTFTDNCGNSATCVQLISVEDTVPPEIIGCPCDTTVECDAVPSPAAVTATDNCDSFPKMIYTEVRTDGSCVDSYVLTRTWTAEDNCGNESTCVQVITVEDTTAPVITCPPHIQVNADVGTCEAVLCPGPASATDNCDENVVIAGVRSDFLDLCSDPYPAGVTTVVTWTATDNCGNESSCMQTVTVYAVNEMTVSVELQGATSASHNRCIRFELWNCSDPDPVPAVVEHTFTFVDGLATDTIEVPCGFYTCITARDPLHTLRRTLDPLPIVGDEYVADFTGDRKLIGGNLIMSAPPDPCDCIDILDFGAYIGTWPLNYGTGDTDCSTVGPHGDIDGNGLVWTEDWTFIQLNFGQCSEPNCCERGRGGDGQSPITRISVKDLYRRGLGTLAIGDLNRDGWLDTADMQAFMEGARPKKPGDPTNTPSSPTSVHEGPELAR
ncbi:MAG: HYR domain-containing protein [Phycisphaerae bacterium]|nr:HYR domain-containing protein [Phycisphaerae bacterium]